MSSEFLEANIFFFITTVMTVVLGVMLGIVIFYVIKIAKNLREISRLAKEELEEIKEDVDDLRKATRDQLSQHTTTRFSVAVASMRDAVISIIDIIKALKK